MALRGEVIRREHDQLMVRVQDRNVWVYNSMRRRPVPTVSSRQRGNIVNFLVDSTHSPTDADCSMVESIVVAHDELNKAPLCHWVSEADWWSGKMIADRIAAERSPYMHSASFYVIGRRDLFGADLALVDEDTVLLVPVLTDDPPLPEIARIDLTDAVMTSDDSGISTVTTSILSRDQQVCINVYSVKGRFRHVKRSPFRYWDGTRWVIADRTLIWERYCNPFVGLKSSCTGELIRLPGGSDYYYVDEPDLWDVLHAPAHCVNAYCRPRGPK